jgi:8-oxo-dGTP diphosphatase
MTKHCYDWPRPAVTTDVAVFADRDGEASILLIQRGGEPFAGCWALPGGFLEEDETLEVCATRELKEETGLEAGPLRLFGTYSTPGRDPRGRTVTVAYWTRAEEGSGEATAGDDAADCRWFALNRLPTLAFDHDRIIADAVRSLTYAASAS